MRPCTRERKSAPSAQANASQKRCSTAASWARVAVACGAMALPADAEDQLMRDRPLHRADRKSADAALIGKADRSAAFVTS